MRMWMIEPRLMCDQHLRGEHVELHMLVGSLQRHRSIAGYLAKGLLEPTELYRRHRALAAEMLYRGMKHRSSLPLVNIDEFSTGYVDPKESLSELSRRCVVCRALIGARRGHKHGTAPTVSA